MIGILTSGRATRCIGLSPPGRVRPAAMSGSLEDDTPNVVRVDGVAGAVLGKLRPRR
jgi:hypothetical protein